MEAEKLLQELHHRLAAEEGIPYHQASTPNQLLSDAENEYDEYEELEESKYSNSEYDVIEESKYSNSDY